MQVSKDQCFLNHCKITFDEHFIFDKRPYIHVFASFFIFSSSSLIVVCYIMTNATKWHTHPAKIRTNLCFSHQESL